MKYYSVAKWPLSVYKGMYGDGITVDSHQSYDHAFQVCKALEQNGFGGNHNHFPIETYVANEHPHGE